MPQHVLPVLCKQSKRSHEDIIAENPEALFCLFCSHALQPSPIVIRSSDGFYSGALRGEPRPRVHDIPRRRTRNIEPV